jgi:hypothetical protein
MYMHMRMQDVLQAAGVDVAAWSKGIAVSKRKLKAMLQAAQQREQQLEQHEPAAQPQPPARAQANTQQQHQQPLMALVQFADAAHSAVPRAAPWRTAMPGAPFTMPVAAAPWPGSGSAVPSAAPGRLAGASASSSAVLSHGGSGGSSIGGGPAGDGALHTPPLAWPPASGAAGNGPLQHALLPQHYCQGAGHAAAWAAAAAGAAAASASQQDGQLPHTQPWCADDPHQRHAQPPGSADAWVRQLAAEWGAGPAIDELPAAFGAMSISPAPDGIAAAAASAGVAAMGLGLTDALVWPGGTTLSMADGELAAALDADWDLCGMEGDREGEAALLWRSPVAT